MFARLTAAVLVFAVAMAYVESAVVVYLRAALGAGTGDVFPIDLSREALQFGAIELGREAATVVMIAAVGWIVGRRGWERLAWAGIVFGAWDIAYYFWLWVFSGWPDSLATWDLLFLLPLPWAGPIWAPIVISLLLVGFGLALARRYQAGLEPRAGVPHLAGLLLGGLVVIVSLLLNAGVVLDGGVPTEFAWPVFGAGIGIGLVAAWGVLRSAGAGRLRA